MPEWPIGTALKAVADRNASRGFESRPLCVSTYRLDRGHAAVATGVLVIAAGVLAFVAFLASSPLTAVLVVLLLAAAAVFFARPPSVIRLDADGFRARRASGRWTDVENVSLESGILVLASDQGRTHRVPLASVGRRGPELVHEVYDRLNTAHGYRRFDP